LLLAVHHPELVRTLILEDPSAFPVLFNIPPKPGEILPLLFRQPRTLWMALTTTASFGRMALGCGQQSDLACRARAPRSDRLDGDGRARGIQKPTLLISGEKSGPPLRAVVQRLAELIPNSEVRVIPNASHGMNFQNPAAVDAAIVDFLEKHPDA